MKHYRGVNYVIAVAVSGKAYLSVVNHYKHPPRTVFESVEDAEEYLRLWVDGFKGRPA